MNKLILSKIFISRLKIHTLLLDLVHRPTKTFEDLQFILEKLKKLKFFREFLENTLKGSEFHLLLNLCGSIQHEFFSRGEVIIRQNDPSNNKMYLILTGSAYVMRSDITYDVSVEASELLLETPKILKSSSIRKIKKNFTHVPKDGPEFEEYLKRTYGKVLRQIKNGDGFGEQALLWNVRRTATVVASGDCDLLVIEKKDFAPILEEYKRAYFRKEDLIDEVFPKIKKQITSSKIIEPIIFSFKFMSFLKGAILTQENSDNTNGKLFIVENGEFLVEKKINESQLVSLANHDGIKLKYPIHTFIHDLKICQIGRGSIIGEETIFREKGTYSYTVSCISKDASVLCLTKKEIKAHFPRFFMEDLLVGFQNKQEIRKELIFEQVLGIYEKLKGKIVDANKKKAEKNIEELKKKEQQEAKIEKLGETIETGKKEKNKEETTTEDKYEKNKEGTNTFYNKKFFTTSKSQKNLALTTTKFPNKGDSPFSLILKPERMETFSEPLILRTEKTINLTSEEDLNTKEKPYKNEESSDFSPQNKGQSPRNHLIIRNKQDVKLKQEIKKITKTFLISQTAAYLKGREELVTQHKLETPLQTLPDLKDLGDQFHDIFGSNIGKKQKKIMDLRIISVCREKSPQMTPTIKKSRSWLVDRFLAKTKENITLMRKNSFTNSSNLENDLLTKSIYADSEEFDEPYGLGVRALNLKKNNLLKISKEHKALFRKTDGPDSRQKNSKNSGETFVKNLKLVGKVWK